MTDTMFRTTVVDLSTDATTVSTVPSLLRGVEVQVANSAQVVPIKNGSSGTTQYTLPASSSVGIWYEAGDARFPAGIYVDPDNSATGTISVTWKPLPVAE
jgi:hypothetical protein